MATDRRPSSPRFCLAVAALLLAAGPAYAPAQDSPPARAAAPKLRVVIRPVKPFVMLEGDSPAGYSIDLWERVAQAAGLTYEFVKVRTTREMLGAVEDGSADVAVGALSITADREARFDFSHAYYESGLLILSSGRPANSGFGAFAGLLKADVLKVIGVLLLALLINSHLLWAMERKRNPESFPQSYAAGVWESIWWSVCTFITGGCENKAPAGVAGRLVAIVWMLAGVGLFSYITATIASTMTVDTLTGDIRTLADVRGKTVGTVEGSTAEAFLKHQGIEPRTFPDVESACKAVAEGRLRAVVYDAPMLRYQLNAFADPRLILAGAVFDKQDYGFVLRPGSPYRKAINLALLRLSEEGFTDELEKKWFGTAP